MALKRGGFALLLLSIILITTLASARPAANVRTIEAIDANWAQHAAFDEDFNVLWSGSNADINSDHNYMVRINYQGTYVDLNRMWDNNAEALSETVLPATMNAASNCSPGLDLNIVKPSADNNFIDIHTRIQMDLPDANLFRGREVVVELWKVVNAGDGTWLCIEKDANVSFIITPAIILQASANPLDQNVTVMGYGFTDTNLFITYHDVNGEIVDLNIVDVNYFNNPHNDGNTHDIVYSGLAPVDEASTAPGSHVQVDGNGNFDVNIVMPYTATLPHASGLPDHNITVAAVNQGDVNVSVIPMPGLTIATDINVTVMICNQPTATTCYSGGTRKSITEAMRSNDINNLESVKGIIVQMGAPLYVKIELNSDLNMAKGPLRNYTTNTDKDSGRLKIDTIAMPEFAVDANITLYNVGSYNGAMPILARDGIKCEPGICTNLDNSGLSSGYTDPSTSLSTWAWNSSAKDGNLMFRVSTFSSYSTISIDMNVVYPNGGEHIRTTDGTDGNMQILFQFSDSNAAATPVVRIALSDTNNDFDQTFIQDINVLDSLHRGINNSGLFCTDLDGNTQTIDGNCSFDLNIWWIVGAYFVDINIMHGDQDGNAWVTDSSDSTFFINAAKVTITDTNFSSMDWNFTKKSDDDVNYLFDFNVNIPLKNDAATLDVNDIDDYNFSIYLVPLPLATGVRGADLNVGNWAVDGNLGDYCYHYSPDYFSTKGNDINCTVAIDLNGIPENRYLIRVDVNYGRTETANRSLVDGKESDQNVIINDLTAPTVTITDPSRGSATTISNNYQVSWNFSDNSGIKTYWASTDNTVWTALSESHQSYVLNLSSPGQDLTFYLKATDKVDINGSTVTASFRRTGGLGPEPRVTPAPSNGDPVSPPSEAEGVAETIIEETVSIKPTAKNIRELLTEVGASQQAIEKAGDAVAKTTVERTIKVKKITQASGAVRYRTTIVITVSNPGNKTLRNIKVIEKIPKGVISRIEESDVSTNFPFAILMVDPVIEFTVDEVKKGESKEIEYLLQARAKQSDIDEWAVPIVAELQEVLDLCADVVCEERTCQGVLCDKQTGQCIYENLRDGTSCPTGTCRAGTCVAPTAPTIPTPPAIEVAAPGFGIETITLLVLIIVAIAGAAYFFYSKKQ